MEVTAGQTIHMNLGKEIYSYTIKLGEKVVTKETLFYQDGKGASLFVEGGTGSYLEQLQLPFQEGHNLVEMDISEAIDYLEYRRVYGCIIEYFSNYIERADYYIEDQYRVILNKTVYSLHKFAVVASFWYSYENQDEVKFGIEAVYLNENQYILALAYDSIEEFSFENAVVVDTDASYRYYILSKEQVKQWADKRGVIPQESTDGVDAIGIIYANHHFVA